MGAAWAHPWVEGVITEEPVLLIVGSYRCGTTSLFDYLADHPALRPCIIKEPGFFFSERWAAQPSFYPLGEEASAYLRMFRGGAGGLRMEATSNYLHDPGCAERIRAALPNARIVVTLRAPAERLLSWYNFLRFQGWLPAKVDFAGYVARQLEDPRPEQERPYLDRAVAHGHYGRYLEDYVRVFPEAQRRVLWQEDLAADPRGTMIALAEFLDIDPAPFARRSYPVSNPARRIARRRLFRAYRRLNQALLRPFDLRPWWRFHARNWFFGVVEPWLLPLFTAPATPVAAPPELLDTLRRDYATDLDRLGRLVGAPPPWRQRYSAA